MKNYLKLLIALFLLVLISCKKKTIEQEIGEINCSNPIQSPLTNYSTSLINSSPSIVGCENWVCEQYQIAWAIAPDKFPNFDPNSEVIVVGLVVNGNSIDKPTPEIALLRRSGGRIVISSINGTEKSFVELDEITLSNVFQAANDMIAANSGITNGSWNFNIEEVRAVEELAIHMEAEADILGFFGFDSKFSFDENEEMNRFLVTFDHNIFNLFFERPLEYMKFFHPEVTVEEVEEIVCSDNPLVYFSTVTYGRKFYLLIESTSDKEEMKLSMSADFGGIIQGSGGYESISQFNDLRIRAAAIGGVSDSLITAINPNNLNQLAEILSTSGDMRSAAPISYVLRSLATNEIIKNGVATEYEVKECYPLNNSVIECENGGALIASDCSCDCPCLYKGITCNETKDVKRESSREVKRGSNPQVNLENWVASSNSDQVLVSLGIGVKNNNVEILKLGFRTLNPDGTMGNITYKTGGSGTIEQEYQVPSGKAITGLKIGVKDSNVNAFEVSYRSIVLDENNCKLKWTGSESTYQNGTTQYEAEFNLSEETNNNFEVIQGFGSEVSDSNIRAIVFKLAEIELK